MLSDPNYFYRLLLEVDDDGRSRLGTIQNEFASTKGGAARSGGERQGRRQARRTGSGQRWTTLTHGCHAGTANGTGNGEAPPTAVHQDRGSLASHRVG